jgi:hypothetical protein
MGVLGPIPDLNSLADVSVITPQNKNLFAFNSANQRWENKTIAELTINLDDIINININDPQNGQVLMYEDNTWINNYATKADRPFQFFLTSFV